MRRPTLALGRRASRLILLTSATTALALSATACDEDDSAALGPIGTPTADVPTGSDAAGFDAATGTDTQSAGDPDTAAGPDTAGPAGPAACDPPTGNALTGMVYVDADGSDASLFASSFDSGTDLPIAGWPMSLLSADGLIEFATCDNGRFAISDLADGPYVVAPAPPEAPCTTRNCGGGRFFEALTAGAATVVTFGDSVPKVGDAPMFPARLAQLLAPIATIDNRNVAVPGTVSSEWLPGSNLFTGTLAPHIPAGDLFVISLGGNDIMASLQDPSLLADIPGAIQATKELVVEIVARVQAIVDAIREVNPDADIVYCLYPNYGQATETMPWSLAGQFLGPETMIEILETARGAVPTLDGFLLADMYGAFEGVKLDDYLYDPLHFNALGQTRYAEHLFATLGGVLVGPTPRAPHGITPLGLETRFGFSEAPY